MCMCLGFILTGFAVDKWCGTAAIIDPPVRSFVKRFGQREPLCMVPLANHE